MLNKLIELREEGVTAKKARGYLVYEYNVEGKEATALLKEAGFTTGSKEGGRATTLAFLEEGFKTEAELYSFVLENGTKNEARWVSQTNGIRLLLAKVYTKFGEDCVEEAASKELRAELKALVEGE